MKQLLSDQDIDHIAQVFNEISDYQQSTDVGVIQASNAQESRASLTVMFNSATHAEFSFWKNSNDENFGLRVISFGKYTDLDLLDMGIMPEARIEFYNDSEFSHPWDLHAPLETIITVERMRYMKKIVDRMAVMLSTLGEEGDLF